MRGPNADDEFTSLLRGQSSGSVHEIFDRSRTASSIPGNSSLCGNAPTHSEREQPPGEITAVR